MSDVQSVPGFHFIVKYAGVYYLTQELWKFDPTMDTSTLSQDQKIALAGVPVLYSGGTDKADGAVHVSHADVANFTEIGHG